MVPRVHADLPRAFVLKQDQAFSSELGRNYRVAVFT